MFVDTGVFDGELAAEARSVQARVSGRTMRPGRAPVEEARRAIELAQAFLDPIAEMLD